MTERVYKSGFTLLECCIASALCLILLSIGFGTLSYVRAWLIRSDIHMLQAVCRYAQQCAVISARSQVIHLDIEGNCYRLNGRLFKLSPGVCFGVPAGVMGPPSGPVRELVYPCTFAHNQIVCSPHGIISSGAVYLSDSSRSMVYALSNAVSHVSYMRMYVYKDSWQILNP
jgi:hypothetical protein